MKDEQVVVEEVKKWGLEREVEEKLVWWIEWMGELRRRQKLKERSSWLWRKGKDGFYLSHRWKERTRGEIAICFFPYNSNLIRTVTFFVGIDSYKDGKLSGRYDVGFLVPPKDVIPEELQIRVDGIPLLWAGEKKDINFRGAYGVSVRDVPPPNILEVGDLRIPLYWEEFWDGE